MFHAIAIIRPQLVVWENVQGALSASAFSLMEPDQGHLGGRPTGPVLRALGRVLGDLAGIGYDATWTTVHASDVGAPHKRARVFVVAHPHGEPWLERWEPTTRETPGGRSWSDVSGRDRTPRTLIPTPTASDWKGGYHQEGKGMSLSQATRLLPTPVAQASGNSAEAHLRGRSQAAHKSPTSASSPVKDSSRPEASFCPPRRPPTPPTHPPATGLTSTRQQEPYATVSAPTRQQSHAGKPSPDAQPQPRQNRPYAREASPDCLSASSNGSWAYPMDTSRVWDSLERRRYVPSVMGSSPCKQPKASCDASSKNAKSPSRRAGQNTRKSTTERNQP